jgi:hypothetical protein
LKIIEQNVWKGFLSKRFCPEFSECLLLPIAKRGKIYQVST